MQNKNQYYNLIITLIFFCNLLFLQNIIADAKPTNEQTTPEIINVFSDSNNFDIKLKSNPTTGYSWYLSQIDNDLISATKKIYKSDNNFNKGKQVMTGVGGVDIWSFKVNKKAFAVPMITKIKLNYIRPWELNSDSPSNPETTKEIVIIINPGETPNAAKN